MAWVLPWCGVTEASARQPHSARLTASFVTECAREGQRESQWFSKGHPQRPNIRSKKSPVFCSALLPRLLLPLITFWALIYCCCLLRCDKIPAASVRRRNERLLHLNMCETWAGLRNAAGWLSCSLIFTPSSTRLSFSSFLYKCAFTYRLWLLQ